MKLKKEEIEKIKNLYDSGKKMIEISRELKIPHTTVQYHSNEEYREKNKLRAREYFKKNPKRKYPEKRRIYMRNYMRMYLAKKRENERTSK